MKCLLGILTLTGVLLIGGMGLMTTMQSTTGSAVAAERTVTLAVDKLRGNCPSCAFIIDRSLSRLNGVVRVQVSTRTGEAVVTFDDVVVDIATLTQATAAVGFPSQPVE